MSRRIKILILICAVVLVFILAAPVWATQTAYVSGTFDYIPEILREWQAGNNTYLIGREDEVWNGDPGFDGSGDAVWKVKIDGSGDAWVKLKSDFVGTLFDDFAGELFLYLEGIKPANEDWLGTWWITGGTGELSEVTGGGAWWGPGFDGDPETTDIYYDGQVDMFPYPYP